MFVMGSVEDDLALARMNKVIPRNKKNSEEDKLHSKKNTRYGHLLNSVMVLLTMFGLKTHYKYFWWTRGKKSVMVYYGTWQCYVKLHFVAKSYI